MNITVKDLLDAGVHFGHQLRRWNPKSKPYVFDHRHGISIIDLEKTYNKLEEASRFVEDLVASGKDILLVGTKKQAKELIRETAVSTGMPFCANRWMGGTLTNFATIKTSLAKYRKFLDMEADGRMAKLPKKESAAIRRQMDRMLRNFEGLKEVKGLPGCLFVVDIKHEEIAVAEARMLGIPVVAIVDTNSDPTKVTHPIPGNDDAVKSIRIIVEVLSEAIQNGVSRRDVSMNQRDYTPRFKAEAYEEDRASGVTLSAGIERYNEEASTPAPAAEYAIGAEEPEVAAVEPIVAPEDIEDTEDAPVIEKLPSKKKVVRAEDDESAE
ncbi:MAG: 30S ribosomal protein S2 [Opitutales bacterium]|nr:30S ribosomal protein S2 [Opitutales bacterium]